VACAQSSDKIGEHTCGLRGTYDDIILEDIGMNYGSCESAPERALDAFYHTSSIRGIILGYY
jgi:hypothetical protein